MNERMIRLMGYFGIASPIIGFLMVYLSIQSTPGFNIFTQTLSELGSKGFGAVLFNSGLPITGAFMLPFSKGLWETGKDSIMGLAGSIIYIGVSAILMILGIATINVQPVHYYLSVTLFVLIPFSIIAFGLHLLEKGFKIFAVFGFLLGAASIVIWLIGGPVNGFKELVSVTSLAIWQISIGYWMTGAKIPEEED